MSKLGRPRCLRLVLGMIVTHGPMRVRDVSERVAINANPAVMRLADLGMVIRIAGKTKLWGATARGSEWWARYVAEVSS